MKILTTTVFSLFLCFTVFASDVAKEKRWADQVVDAILDGDAEWLQAGDHEFLSIYTEAEDESDAALIVIHGTGIHPDWDQVVKPLRVEMTSRGWHTLSIQMPILHNEASYEDYVPLYPEVPARIQAAENFLKEKGIKRIILLAHSQGATMSSYYLANNKSTAEALVAIGMSAAQKDTHINSATSLSKIDIPVLDLYGSEDLEDVLKTVDKRAAAAKHNKAYRQQMVKDANHFFDGQNTALIEAVDGFVGSL